MMSNFKRPELLLTNVCLEYLSFKEFEIGAVSSSRAKELEVSYPLLSYAAKYRRRHIHSTDEANGDLKTLETILKGPNLKLWISVERKGGLYVKPNQPSLCNVAIYYNIG